MVYANERPVLSDRDVIAEARAMDAQGTGITGGDPVVQLDRTLHYARLLKHEFSDHHIHLYTASQLKKSILQRMEGIIDEIRIHVIDFSDISSVKKALHYNISVGVEIPMLPSRIKETKNLIQRLKGIGVHFINLNELEYADRNSYYLKEMGYSFSADSCVVLNSEKTALTLADEVVHYCSAHDKDSIQLKNRFIRRAHTVKKVYEEIEHGLLVKGVITCESEEQAQTVKRVLLSKVDVLDSFVCVVGTRVETHWALAEEASSWITAKIGIEKRYPTYDQPLIEYIPVR